MQCNVNANINPNANLNANENVNPNANVNANKKEMQIQNKKLTTSPRRGLFSVMITNTQLAGRLARRLLTPAWQADRELKLFFFNSNLAPPGYESML